MENSPHIVRRRFGCTFEARFLAWAGASWLIEAKTAAIS
jgi:hypothetical protein